MAEKFEDLLKEIHIEYKKVLSSKGRYMFWLYFYGIVGILTIAGGYLLGSLAWEKGVISTVPILIMGVGLYLIAMGLAHLTRYRSNLSIARKKKNEINSILERYAVKYTIDVTLGKEYHGTQDVDVALNWSGNA